MHVVVVGCGRVGARLASRLDDEGHSVVVVDRRADALDKLPAAFSGRTVQGVGFDRDRLLAADIESADALAAVTSGDNSNILIARVAREAFGVKNVVARIYDPHRAAIYERLGIPTIATVQWTTDRVLARLLPTYGEAVWVDPTAAVSLLERPVPTHWAGRPVAALETRCGARVVSVSRAGESWLAEPSNALQDGDVVWAAVESDRLEAFDLALAEVPVAGGHH